MILLLCNVHNICCVIYCDPQWLNESITASSGVQSLPAANSCRRRDGTRTSVMDSTEETQQQFRAWDWCPNWISHHPTNYWGYFMSNRYGCFGDVCFTNPQKRTSIPTPEQFVVTIDKQHIINITPKLMVLYIETPSWHVLPKKTIMSKFMANSMITIKSIIIMAKGKWTKIYDHDQLMPGKLIPNWWKPVFHVQNIFTLLFSNEGNLIYRIFRRKHMRIIWKRGDFPLDPPIIAGPSPYSSHGPLGLWLRCMSSNGDLLHLRMSLKTIPWGFHSHGGLQNGWFNSWKIPKLGFKCQLVFF